VPEPHPDAKVSATQSQVVALQHTPQGVGEQVPPATGDAPAGQPAVVTIEQAPVVLSQHAPQEAEAQATPHRKMLGAEHAVGGRVVHEPFVGLQHAPVHGLTAQEVLGPAKTEPAGQPLSTSIVVHAQVEVLQHAPLHAFWLEHAPTVKSPGGHEPVFMTKHMPVVWSQQVGSGTHVAHDVQSHVPVGLAQLACVVLVHTPVTMLQHLPMHGRGVQVPLP
jgi:hypothetical protein